jgi:hypothetical protein
MITVITLKIGLYIGAFIGFILAAVLAMDRDSDESASKSFADWINLKIFLDERHFGLRHSQMVDYRRLSNRRKTNMNSRRK